MPNVLTRLAARLRRNDLVKHGTLVFAGIMFANAFMYVFYALVGRIVGVEGYGIVSALFSATLVLGTAPATVVATIIVRMAADLHATGDFHKLRRLGDVVNIGAAMFAVIAFGLVAAFSSPIAQYFHLLSIKAVLAAGLILALGFALPLQRGVFQGTQHFGEFSISSTLEGIVKAIAGPLMAIHFGPTGALLGLCIGGLIAALYNAFILRRLYGATPERLQFDFRSTFGASIRTAVPVLAINGLLFYDIVLVRHFFSAIDAGLYGAASLAGRALYTVVSFVPTILLPKATAHLSKGTRTVGLLAASLGVAVGLVAITLVVVAMFPRLIVVILAGRNFADAGALVLRYTLAVGALALANIIVMYQIGTKRFAFILPLSIVAVAEIATVALWHPSVFTVLGTLTVGHCVACIAALYGLPLRVSRLATGSATQGGP